MSVCVGGHRASDPLPHKLKIRALLCSVPLALQAVQSRRSSWGEGRGARGGDQFRDGGSYRAFAEQTLKPRTALGDHLVAPGRPRKGARTLAGSNLKGLPGPVPRLALLRRRLGQGADCREIGTRKRAAAPACLGCRLQREEGAQAGGRGTLEGSAGAHLCPSATRRKGERTHFPPRDKRMPARSSQAWETSS